MNITYEKLSMLDETSYRAVQSLIDLLYSKEQGLK